MSESESPLPSAPRPGRVGIPLYSLLAPFPVSFFLGAVTFDSLNAAGIMSQGGAAAHGAYYLLIAGFVAVALLIPLAILEIIALKNASAKKVGIVYIAILLNAALCFYLAFYFRPKPSLTGEEKNPQTAIICSILGGISILVASRIGSYLVFIHRLGVRTPKAIFPALPRARKRHPLHTLFAHLPLGLWFMSIFFDIYANWGQNREPWVVKSAYMCIVIGCAAALCAIVTGFIDWLLTHEEHPAQPWAIFHMITTMAGTACFIFNAGERWTQINYLVPKLNVVVLSQIGYAVILFGSIIGMRLVYKNNVTVAPAPQLESA
jgi:uncharacterized membrane protein